MLGQVRRIDDLYAAPLLAFDGVSADDNLLLLQEQAVVIRFLGLIFAIDRFQADFGVGNSVDAGVELGNLRVGLVQKLLLPIHVAIGHRDLGPQRKQTRIG